MTTLQEGNIPWNKGLTKETDERVRKSAKNESISQRKKYKEGYINSFTGKQHTEKSKTQMSNTLILSYKLGRIHHNLGKNKDNYSPLKIVSEKMKGDNNPMKRKEARKRMRENNPMKRLDVKRKRQQTLKNNSKIIENQVKKRLQTYTDNPEIMENAIKKFKQTIKDNPDIMENIAKKRLQTYTDNPKIMENQVKKRLQTYTDNPKIMKNAVKKISKSIKQTYKDNPKILKNMSETQSARLQGIDKKNWKGFIGFEPYDQNFTDKFRRAIRKRDNYICLKCGKHQEKEKRALTVHHINYNKKMSIKENCCTICNSCNIEVNTNRKHWTKFFQSLLSEKYGYEYKDDNIIINIEGVENAI